MTTLEIIILALLQGLTEFLPISSSAHLILPSQILGWQDQGLAFDVAVHVGTLLAVMLYFRKELGTMSVAWLSTFNIGPAKNDTDSHIKFEGRLAWWIIFATVPAGLFGLLGKDLIEEHLRSALIIALTTILFGFLLGFADVKAGNRKVHKPLEKLGIKGAMLIGVAQAIALIPGTSRSGITMTIGLMLGLSRDNAARFSFLLSIPAIAMAGSYLTLKLVLSTEAVDWQAIALGSFLAFISAYACIHYFLILLNKLGMMPFVIYRLILGFGLLWFLLA
ncbi:undecaprenyl-diphosphate phosphatase [Colwellia sp. 6_MG-2023]|uniref:undecaprenyl-diphosphate phosphatase n=1 Tax=Colwellia sp. 6_MG-2023 TaxID=3062676 RepID=UPI0026E27C7C|nr:undecaprenyl-diphosphate phosphatase [Colwellia sp. 6_MG-2023]MDO6489430.1 undecaprenyl-diphosphate phosphatase [Colwellia sp. 6_MG-2023]